MKTENLIFRIVYNNPYLCQEQSKGQFTDIEKCEIKLKKLIEKEIKDLNDDEIKGVIEEDFVVEIVEENSNKRMLELEEQFITNFHTKNNFIK